MRIMLTGPHAIGKSTTCESLSKTLSGFVFIPSVAGTIAKEMGFDINANPSFKQTIDYQWKVIKTFEQLFEETAKQNAIFDRSPIDLIGYLAMATRDSPAYDIEIMDYTIHALECVTRYCDLLIYPEADLDAPIEDKYNRPTDRDYREDYADIVRYFFDYCKVPAKMVVPKEHQFQDRVKYIIKHLGEI